LTDGRDVDDKESTYLLYLHSRIFHVKFEMKKMEYR